MKDNAKCLLVLGVSVLLSGTAMAAAKPSSKQSGFQVLGVPNAPALKGKSLMSGNKALGIPNAPPLKGKSMMSGNRALGVPNAPPLKGKSMMSENQVLGVPNAPPLKVKNGPISWQRHLAVPANSGSSAFSSLSTAGNN